MVTMERLPAAPDAEQQLIGAAMLLPEIVPDIRKIVDERDFTTTTHKIAWREIGKLAVAGAPIEHTSLMAALRDRSEFPDGAACYLLETGQSVNSAYNAEYYARKVKDAAVRRQIIAVSESAIAGAMNGDTTQSVLNCTHADLQELSRQMLSSPKLIPVSNIESISVDWAWTGWLPRGMLTLLDGDPEKGKSQITCALAGCWTTEKPFPFALRDMDHKPGNVLMVATEDNADCIIRPRLEAAGADLDRVFLWPEDVEPLAFPHDVDRLRAAIVEHDVSLVILDPITAYLHESINANRDSDVRRAMRPLVALAQEMGVSVLGVRHLNKDSGKSALYRGGGSIGFIAAARVAWAVGLDPNDSSHFVLAVLKSNIGPKPASIFYRIESWEGTSRIHWQSESIYTATDIIVTQKKRGPGKRAHAEDIIVDLLDAGPKAEKEVLRACEAASISHRTYMSARRELGVKSSKIGLDCWELSLPKDANEVEECKTNFNHPRVASFI